MKIGIVVTWPSDKADEALKELAKHPEVPPLEKCWEGGLLFFRPAEDLGPREAFEQFEVMCKTFKPLGTGVERIVYVWDDSPYSPQNIARYAARCASELQTLRDKREADLDAHDAYFGPSHRLAGELSIDRS